MIRQVFLGFFLLIFGIVGAQDNIKQLSIEEAVVAATKENKAVQLAGMDEKIAAARYKQTDAIYLPQVGLSYTAFSTNNPLNAFGFKLQQKSIGAADFNPDVLNHPKGTPDFMTKIEVQQPIINMDLLYMRKAAAKQTEIYGFATQRTKEHIAFETQKAYLQLQLLYSAKKVLAEALITAKAMQQQANNYLQQGLIQKSDVLNAQVQISTIETQIAETNSNIHNASDYLSLLMGKPTGIIYTTVESKQLFIDTIAIIPTNRADFKATEKALESFDLMIQSTKKSYLPKLNAFGSFQLNDSRMLGFGANAYLAGIQLSWNIFKGNSTKNSIATQQIERSKLNEQLTQQKEQSQLQLNQTKRQFADARFKLKQAEQSIEQSSEALRILQNRYNQGLVKTNDVLMAQTQLAQQKLGYTQAEFEQQMAALTIQFLTKTIK